MPVKRPPSDTSAEADMTPMIDMTFQLIAFFMVLINFADDNQDQRVRLPSSELAKPPEAAVETPIVLQVAQDGKVLFNGDELAVNSPQMNQALRKEASLMKAKGLSPKSANIIIRGHGLAKTGEIQQLIATCQMNDFEKFMLRAEQGKRQSDSQIQAADAAAKAKSAKDDAIRKARKQK